MKNTTPLATVVAVCLTLAGTMVCQADDESRDQWKFDKHDTNKDGSISLEEFKARAADPAKAEKKFANFDKDKNGSLSRDEFPPKGAKKAKDKPATDAAESTESADSTKSTESAE